MALPVAIVGCGKIADQHVQAIRRAGVGELVAVCDSELMMAAQLAERFGVAGRFTSVEEMLDAARPAIVHVTTPAQSHSTLAETCLRGGSHVYLEKPFTVTAAEARHVLDIAQERGLMVTAGHNYQFTGEMIRMRRMVGEGYVGAGPFHVESYWSYDLGDSSYVGPMLGNPNHWVRRLPGQLIQNLMSHGIARIAEFLTDDIEHMSSVAFQSERLKGMGATGLHDELRVLLKDSRGTTATFCFSTEMKPGINQFHLRGDRASIAVDLMSGALRAAEKASYKSYLTYLVPPLKGMSAEAGNAWRNATDIAFGRLHQDFGMKELVGRFHASVASNGPPPIPYAEIMRTATLMDRIIQQSLARGA